MDIWLLFFASILFIKDRVASRDYSPIHENFQFILNNLNW